MLLQVAPVEPKEEPIDDDDIQEIQPRAGPKSMKDFPNVQLIIQPVGEKYNTLRYLDSKKPNVIVFYNSDVSNIRTVEVSLRVFFQLTPSSGLQRVQSEHKCGSPSADVRGIDGGAAISDHDQQRDQGFRGDCPRKGGPFLFVFFNH